MKHTVIGGTGLIGSQVVQKLTAAGHRPSPRRCPPASTTPGHSVFGKPATLLEVDKLEVDKEVSPGIIGDRFALKRQLGDDEHDPVSCRP